MNETVLDSIRHLMPRWRDFQTTVRLGELGSGSATSKVSPSDDGNLNNRLADWEANQSLSFAADLICCAIVAGREDLARDAAEFVFARKSSTSPLLVRLATSVIRKEPESYQDNLPFRAPPHTELRSRVSRLKAKLAIDPRNAISLIDIARCYTVLAQVEKAHKAIERAVAIAPRNRFIVRSAVRFFIHTSNLDDADWVLRRCPIVFSDPWLLSVRYSLSHLREKAIPGLKHGLGLLQSGHFSPMHLAELAAVLGSIEHRSGKDKKASQLFARALEKPTENALAQVIASVDSNQRDRTLSSKADVPKLHEAKARTAVAKSQWSEAIDECELWYRDQPFSKLPASLGSYLASCITGEFNKAMEFVQLGLDSNPKDLILLNNKAFCEIETGQLEAAKKTLENVQGLAGAGEADISLEATRGLLAYRCGFSKLGALHYGEAKRRAKAANSKRNSTLVDIFHMREIARSRPGEAKTVLGVLEKIDSEAIETDIKAIVGNFTKQIRDIRHEAGSTKP